jgi:hypothetical protein
MIVRLAASAAALLVGTLAAGAQTCRVPSDLPPGVRIPLAPGCKTSEPSRPRSPEKLRQPGPGTRPGFIDLGNGTEVRIDGRVRAETVLHR